MTSVERTEGREARILAQSALEEWLVFEMNDYLRLMRPATDLRDELS